MEKEEVRASLVALIEEEMPELGTVDLNKDIVAEYGINSVSLISLIVAAENKYDIKFTGYELALDDYPTFEVLSAVIKSKLDKKDD
jgi:acyl carrier protein